jgi:hypothetical protein
MVTKEDVVTLIHDTVTKHLTDETVAKIANDPIRDDMSDEDLTIWIASMVLDSVSTGFREVVTRTVIHSKD